MPQVQNGKALVWEQQLPSANPTQQPAATQGCSHFISFHVEPWKVRAGPAELASGFLLNHRQQDTRPEDSSSHNSATVHRNRANEVHPGEAAPVNDTQCLQHLGTTSGSGKLHFPSLQHGSISSAGSLGKS